MTLTAQEEHRILDLEKRAADLERIMKGIASKNMLNQMKTLVEETMRKINEELDELEPKLQELIEKADAAQ